MPAAIIRALSALIITGGGYDRVILETDNPEAIWPYKGPLLLEFRASQGGGEAYLAKNFPGLPYEVVDRVSQFPRSFPPPKE